MGFFGTFIITNGFQPKPQQLVIRMERILKIFMLFLMCFSVGNAQENAKTHKVSRGETIIDIAKQYNVTPYDIQQANPNTLTSLDKIKEHDVLIIPESKIKSTQLNSASEAIKSSISTTSLTYKVKKGDTKYGLSKRFGVSISDLEIFNPQIVVGLNEGHILRIDSGSRDSSNESTPTSPSVATYSGYQNHLVIKGETLYGISKANGLTVDQLVELNADVLTGVLREGQTLKVPNRIQAVSVSYKKHTVSKGETKYGLSKKFQTTIETLERLNPHIIKMLQIGHVLTLPDNDAALTYTEDIPKDTTEEKLPETNPSPITDTPVTALPETEKQESVNDIPNSTDTLEDTKEVVSIDEKLESVPSNSQPSRPTTYDSYEIKPKETLYSLSKKAGMSISDFVILNPQIKESVQIGTIIKIPSKVSGTNQGSFNTSPPATGTSNRYTDLSKSLITNTIKKLIFILPFKNEDFNQELKDNTPFNSVSDAFLKEHLEFYSGAKMALDSVKKLGITVQIKVIEIEKDKRDSKMTEFLKEETSKKYDALILPFYESIEDDVVTAVTNQNIPVITAATIAHQQTTNNLFGALPSINQQRKKILDYLLAQQGNIIVLSDANRSESKDFIAQHVPDAKFVDVKKNGTFRDTELLELLHTDQLNFVILDSDRNSVFLNATNTLLSELNNYNLQLAVLDASLIPDSDDVSTKRFRILKMLFPSLTPALTTPQQEKFSRRYQSIYSNAPSINAMIGFDMTFDTLLRLSQQQSFEVSAINDITEYITLKFNYQNNGVGGYHNEGIYILQHDTDVDLKEVN